MDLLRVVQISFVISMHQFVDKLILPLFLVHTVFMILSLLCALTSPLPPLVSEGANERSYYS